MKDYHINIFYSDEDEAYVADIPDLVSCSAIGRTPGETLAEVEKAEEASTEDAKASCKPVPPPRHRPIG